MLTSRFAARWPHLTDAQNVLETVIRVLRASEPFPNGVLPRALIRVSSINAANELLHNGRVSTERVRAVHSKEPRAASILSAFIHGEGPCEILILVNILDFECQYVTCVGLLAQRSSRERIYDLIRMATQCAAGEVSDRVGTVVAPDTQNYRISVSRALRQYRGDCERVTHE